MSSRQTRLADVAAVRGLIGGPFGSNLVSNDYEPAGVPVIRGTNLGHGKYVAGEFAFVSEAKVLRDLSRNVAIPGDVVFTQRGTLGQVALTPADGLSEYVISQSQMRLRVNPVVAVPDFVYYACSAPVFQRQIADNAISTGVPHINLGILGRLTIPLPSVPEQRMIADVLGSLDAKIAASTKLIDTADALCAALTRSALNSLASQSLSSIAVVTMGTSPAGTSFNEDGHGSVFYQGVRDFGVRFPTRRVWTTSPVRFAKANDCLLSVRAPVGQVNLATEETCIGRGLASVRSRDDSPNTLFHLLRDAPEIWAPYEAEGTIFGSINKAQLESIEVPTIVAARADQLEIQLALIEARIASALRENEMLAATRDVLLPLMMSGKLTVSHAVEAVEAVA